MILAILDSQSTQKTCVYVQCIEVRAGLFILVELLSTIMYSYYGHLRFPINTKSMHLCSMHWGEKWLFVLLILVELLTVYGWLMVFNATFNNMSVISWRSVLLVEETRVPGENHRLIASHWPTLSHNVASSTSPHEQGTNSQL